jgi:hypothetical protein
VVVEGVKTQLDILIHKLATLFKEILEFKERLYAHPLLEEGEATLKLAHFQGKYIRLCLNQRLRL